MINKYREQIEEGILKLNIPSSPNNLYDPIRYFMDLGGKRMRPVVCLMACEMFSGECESAEGPALGIELFHNFTLVHDDIMDEAPLRRGMPTVHAKWNRDVGILSGDAMFVIALQQVMKGNPSDIAALLDVFLQTALEVCEGQQMDMDFEQRVDVSIAEYIEMIRLKTAVLLGCSMKMGAIGGGADPKDADLAFRFGQNLGVAFQLRDDYLDAFGDPEKFGKQVGGDIIAGKKTYLILRAMEVAPEEDRMALHDEIFSKRSEGAERVHKVLQILERNRVGQLVEKEVDRWYGMAMKALEEIEVDEARKENLKSLANWLMERDH